MPKPSHNCPFYGRHLVWWGEVLSLPAMTLLDSQGNQCAIVFGSLSPCYLELENKPVDWRECIRVKDLTPACEVGT